MSLKLGKVTITFAGLFIVITIILTVFLFINDNNTDNRPNNIAQSFYSTESLDQSITTSQSILSSSHTSQNTTSGKKSAGKVVTAFLSPYISNTSYKDIYLNNRTDTKISLEKIYNSAPKIRFEKGDKPEVLIYHTHATEGYLTQNQTEYTAKEVGETKDSKRSVIMAGAIIGNILNSYGIKTVHDKTLHNDPSYTQSYARSAETVKKYMEKYPSIKVVIDVHRDSVSTDGGQIRGISQQNGKDAAQIMFVCGSQTGNVTDHPNWKENLKLVLRLQEISEKLYPGFARSIYFTSKKYNQQLCTGGLLIEVGAAVNTVEEAAYSAELLGRILSIGFGMYVED